MYYIIRAVIFIILCLLFTFFIINLRQKSNKLIINDSINEEMLKQYKKLNSKYCIKISLIFVVILYCIFNAVKFPIEQYFLSFDSETAAFNYNLIDNSIFERYEKDNSIFYVDINKKDKIYGLTRNNDKFSYLDYKNIDITYDLSNSFEDIKFIDGHFNVLGADIKAKYNEVNNITFYYISVRGIEDDMRNKITINGNHLKLIKLQKSTIPTTEITYNSYYYIYFSEGSPYENIRIESDNKFSSFVKN